jgi:hypothetical protein
MLYRLLYISTVCRGFEDYMIEDLLSKAQKKNHQNGITGILVFDGRRFMQYLEGEESKVCETFKRIQQDPRHYAIVTLREGAGEHRQFADWDMAIRYSNRPSEFDTHVKQVAELTVSCDPMVAAEINGFVKLRAA